MAVAATPKALTFPDLYAIPVTATDTPAANTAASITFTGVAGRHVLVHWIKWSYTGAKLAAAITLTITDSTAGVRFRQNIPVTDNLDYAGDIINFGKHPYVGSVGESVVIGLTAPGAGVTVTLTASAY